MLLVYIAVEFRWSLRLSFTIVLFSRTMHSVVGCDALGNPFNGQAVFIETVFGSQANYSCLEGYTLIGNSTRVCQADRQWSGNEPICEGLSNSLYNITFCLIKNYAKKINPSSCRLW